VLSDGLARIQDLDGLKCRVVSIPKCRKDFDRRESAPAIKFSRLCVVRIRACFCNGLDLQEPNLALPEPRLGMGEKTRAMSLAPSICPDRDAMDVPGIWEVLAQRKESDQNGAVGKRESGQDCRVSGIHQQSMFDPEPHGKRAKHRFAFRCALEVRANNFHVGYRNWLTVGPHRGRSPRMRGVRAERRVGPRPNADAQMAH
jgi:hypothetical protein